MANYALRLPESLFDYVKQVAKEEHVSMNQFFVTAIAEKIATLKTEAYFEERRRRAREADFDVWLDASPNVSPMEGDDLIES